MAEARCEAPAKVNLWLHVVGRRADGYHLLDSLVVFAGIGDTVTARPRADGGAGFRLTVDGPFAAAVPAGDDNLVVRAAERLAAAAGGADRGAELHLTKRLPPASGIGGGSADAAATLRALLRLWAIAMPEEELATLGLALGADVPVCLARRPAFVGGIGERIEAAPPLPPAHLLLVNPGVAVSTAEVFQRRQGGISPPARFVPVPASAAELAERLRAARNDLTAAALAIAPVIGDVLTAIGALDGALLARMSGSGATCFGLFATAEAARGAARRLKAAQPGWWVADAPMLRE